MESVLLVLGAAIIVGMAMGGGFYAQKIDFEKEKFCIEHQMKYENGHCVEKKWKRSKFPLN